MRTAFAGLFLAALVSTPAQAIGDLTALSTVQEDCAQVGDVSFGTGGRWPDCRVTRGRWVATIDLVDMYQAQYCLGGGQGGCDQRALLVFGNRAYTPTAKLLVQRIDPGSSEYEDPLVVKNDYGRIMTVSARLADGTSSKDYYLWQAGAWVPLDARSWLRDLGKRLPAGVAARKVSLPDVDNMTATAELYRKGDADCCSSAGVATVELGLRNKRFSLKKLSVMTSPQ